MAHCSTQVIEVKVSPSRLFQAGVIDLHKIAPLVVPDMVTGAKILEGDGGVGTIRQFNFTDAVPYVYFKERIDVLDKENLEYKYTTIESGEAEKKVASESCHFKLTPKDGGCVCTVTTSYTPLPGKEIPAEVINNDKEEQVGMIKAVEEYLLANPQAYA